MAATQLPAWAQWLQVLSPAVTGIGTILIAAIVASIAYRQWRTANAKLALDLFDKRMAVFSDVDQAAKLVAGHGGARNNDAAALALQAWRTSTFLFQNDLRAHLESIVDQILAIEAAENMLEAPENEEVRQQHIKAKWDGVKAIARLRKGLPNQFAPYLRMDHKI